MRQFGVEQTLWLHRLADGECSPISDEALDRFVANGLVRVISPSDADDVRRHERLLSEADALWEEARRAERPGGVRLVALRFAPAARRAARLAASQLRDRADESRREAQRQWLGLSRRTLVEFDLSLCAERPDGAFLSITDPGREAVRALIYSEEFEREVVEESAIQERAELCLKLRGEMLAAGFQKDARLDFAAALLSRCDRDIARFRELNRLMVHARWVNYDRLPLIAGLCQLDGEAADVWERFWTSYETARRHDYPGGYETRIAVTAMLRRDDVDEPSCERLWEVLKRLRYDGWSMGQSTDPVAARLTGLRLSPTRIAARVQDLFKELARGPITGGPFLGLAASVAADTNLHPLTVKAEKAQVMQDPSRFSEFVSRYDELLPRAQDEGSRPTLLPAMLALMPGTAQGNRRRLDMAARAIHPHIPPPNALTLGMALMDSAYPEWFDATRFVWELGSLLMIDDPISVFTAYSRMSPMYSRAAKESEPGKPEGSGAG